VSAVQVQNWIAYLIVALAVGVTFRNVYRKHIVKPLSNFLLKRGKVGLAMRIRNGKRKSAPDCCD
jgi:hypothetical protein